MRRFGLLASAVGAVVFIASLALLKYADFGNGSFKLWDVTTRLPVVLTVLAALTLGLSLLALVRPSRLYPALTTATGFYILGQFFPDSAVSYTVYRPGFWVCVAGAVAMAAGSLISLLAAPVEESMPASYADHPAWSRPGAAATSTGTAGAGLAATREAAPVASAATFSDAPAPAAPSAATEAPTAPHAVPAGWFRDPLGEARERYWSGTEWTHEVRS